MNHDKGVLIGSICVALSQIIFGMVEVIVKKTTLTTVQIACGRYVVQLIIATIWWKIKKPNNENVKNWYGDSPYILNILIRGCLYGIFTITYYYAVVLLPIGDIQCIMYFSPILVVYMARMWLAEALPDLYILIPSTIFTICGLLLLSQPTFLMNIIADNDYQPLNIYGLLSVTVSVICWVFIVLLVRKALDSHFLQLEFVASFCSLFFMVPITAVINQYVIKINVIGGIYLDEWTFDIMSIVTMISVGLFGFIALSLSVIGYQYGTATTVCWLEYINIVFGFFYQAIFFNDFPTKYEILGAVIVTVSSLLPFMQHLYNYCYTRYTKKYKLVNQQSSIDSQSEEYRQSESCV